jgi:hypothetical protein
MAAHAPMGYWRSKWAWDFVCNGCLWAMIALSVCIFTGVSILSCANVHVNTLLLEAVHCVPVLVTSFFW